MSRKKLDHDYDFIQQYYLQDILLNCDLDLLLPEETAALDKAIEEEDTKRRRVEKVEHSLLKAKAASQLTSAALLEKKNANLSTERDDARRKRDKTRAERDEARAERDKAADESLEAARQMTGMWNALHDLTVMVGQHIGVHLANEWPDIRDLFDEDTSLSDHIRNIAAQLQEALEDATTKNEQKCQSRLDAALKKERAKHAESTAAQIDTLREQFDRQTQLATKDKQVYVEQAKQAQEAQKACEKACAEVRKEIDQLKQHLQGQNADIQAQWTNEQTESTSLQAQHTATQTQLAVLQGQIATVDQQRDFWQAQSDILRDYSDNIQVGINLRNERTRLQAETTALQAADQIRSIHERAPDRNRCLVRLGQRAGAPRLLRQ
ncbi:hypothetical protein OPT61_g7003 [Boeremia exigua]|uniref:Uncharacterized protein n=1 Tax=Boeremia exigua TaxID=749465 RepID=A0ACC2I3Z2_9PLEO|nr:hypothetical protein OPT61_g7003 [Boeremia exigua]